MNNVVYLLTVKAWHYGRISHRHAYKALENKNVIPSIHQSPQYPHSVLKLEIWNFCIKTSCISGLKVSNQIFEILCVGWDYGFSSFEARELKLCIKIVWALVIKNPDFWNFVWVLRYEDFSKLPNQRCIGPTLIFWPPSVTSNNSSISFEARELKFFTLAKSYYYDFWDFETEMWDFF